MSVITFHTPPIFNVKENLFGYALAAITATSFIATGSKRRRLSTSSTVEYEGSQDVDMNPVVNILANMIAVKEANSYTRTLTKQTSSKQTKEMPNDDVVSCLKDNFVTAYAKYKTAPGKFHHIRTWSTLSGSSEGLASRTVFNVTGYSDQYRTSVANPGVTQSVIPWFQLNPQEGIAAGQRYNSKGSPANDAIILEHTQFKFEFQNLGSVPCWCVLRCYKSIQAQVGPLSDLQRQSWISSIETPDAALVPPAAAVAATGILAVPNTATTNFVPWTPVIAPGSNSAQHFNEAYKLARKYFFQIPSGGRVMFDIGVKMNQLVNELDAAELGSYMHGCIQWQLEHWGSQVLQTNPVESSVHAPSKIGIITTCHHTFRVPIQNKGLDGRTTMNFQVQAQGATADEKYYDEDTGAIDTPLFAP